MTRSLHNDNSIYRPFAVRQFTVRRRGMTIVELLTIVAIIGILTSLLLPAVQQAREAARRSSCQNNLRQIGIALAAYQQSLKSLPTGCLEARIWPNLTVGKNFAWSALLLPYLEQGNVSNSIDFNFSSDDPRNAAIAVFDLPFYVCPTAKVRAQPRQGRSDYGGLYGQRITTKSNTDNGVFIFNEPIHFHDILDGLTNTLAVAEDTRSPDAQWINGRNIFEQSGGINDPQSLSFDNEIRSHHVGGAMSLFCCGRIAFLSNSTDRLVVAALITRADGDFAESTSY